ncbi:MAG: uroporphyrinogen-III C-methyltransferase [Hyphomicrobiales bacterium]|nr:uroporphyrinogen-III C-methyltransferase [Hyphomicrobiales bacterium]
MPSLLPVFLNLARGPVVVVGCGPQASAVLRWLMTAGATVRWLPGHADVGDETVAQAHGAGRLEVDVGNSTAVELTGVIAVIGAPAEIERQSLAARARAVGIPVIATDWSETSSILLPMHSAGAAADAASVPARRLRAPIDAIAASYRSAHAAASRRLRSLGAAMLAIAGAAQPLRTRTIRAGAGSGHLPSADSRLVEDRQAIAGTVFLVGAGPGDPDLLTVRAQELLQEADLVLYDELVSDAVLKRVGRAAQCMFVGKRRGAPGIGQDAINRRLVEMARSGRKVVRLKGGDAFVFGRGGEEIEHLRAHGIPVAIVPGITAALGCAAEAQLPLTYLSEATRLSFVTAHRAEEAARLDWSGLAARDVTVVVYMGLTAAGAVRDGLVLAGRDPQTPAAVLARGTHPDSRAVVGRLDELPRLAAAAGHGPALLVVGDVVAHSAPWRDALEFLNAQVAA